jgi:D-alanyl-lipoteichoic acid acyltransferase DltB (MBOAT superfamily)
MPWFLQNWAGLRGQEPKEWHWTLPISLSFYAFQSLTYTIDLYRRDTQGTRSLLEHMAAVYFFPNILAEPINLVSAL